MSQCFASEGASVVVADLSPDSARDTVDSLERDYRGQDHMAAQVDVSSKESVKKLLTQIQVKSISLHLCCIFLKPFVLNVVLFVCTFTSLEVL